VHRDGDGSGLPGRYPDRDYLTLALDPVPGPGGGQRGQQWQQDEQPAQGHQLALTQPQPQHLGGRPGGEERPSPRGQSGEQ